MRVIFLSALLVLLQASVAPEAGLARTQAVQQVEVRVDLDEIQYNLGIKGPKGSVPWKEISLKAAEGLAKHLEGSNLQVLAPWRFAATDSPYDIVFALVERESNRFYLVVRLERLGKSGKPIIEPPLDSRLWCTPDDLKKPECDFFKLRYATPEHAGQIIATGFSEALDSDGNALMNKIADSLKARVPIAEVVRWDQRLVAVTELDLGGFKYLEEEGANPFALCTGRNVTSFHLVGRWLSTPFGREASRRSSGAGGLLGFEVSNIMTDSQETPQKAQKFKGTFCRDGYSERQVFLHPQWYRAQE